MTLPLRRAFAIVAGFLAVAALSIAMDAALHANGLLPQPPQPMSDGLYALAATYRALFTLAGGSITTRLSGETSYRPAQILAALGLLAGLAGVAAWTRAPDLGPFWYALSIPVSAIPCTLAGAWIALRGKT